MANLQHELRLFVVFWNRTFPFDKKWREKHSIAFGSEQHLQSNQIDIFIEMLEESMFEESINSYKKDIEKEERYKKDGWLSESEFDNTKTADSFLNSNF